MHYIWRGKAHMRVVFLCFLFSASSRRNNRKRKTICASYVYAACMIIISDCNFNVTWFIQSRLLIIWVSYYFLKVAEGLFNLVNTQGFHSFGLCSRRVSFVNRTRYACHSCVKARVELTKWVHIFIVFLKIIIIFKCSISSLMKRTLCILC